MPPPPLLRLILLLSHMQQQQQPPFQVLAPGHHFPTNKIFFSLLDSENKQIALAEKRILSSFFFPKIFV